MYKHILLPTDGSLLSEQSIGKGVELAKHLNARVTGLYVTPPLYLGEGDEGGVLDPDSKARVEQMTEDRTRKYLAFIEQAAKAAGVPCQCLHVTGASAYAEIIRIAESNRCDLIVMASHGRKGLDGLLLGSETAKVLTHSKLPVLVCH